MALKQYEEVAKSHKVQWYKSYERGDLFKARIWRQPPGVFTHSASQCYECIRSTQPPCGPGSGPCSDPDFSKTFSCWSTGSLVFAEPPACCATYMLSAHFSDIRLHLCTAITGSSERKAGMKATLYRERERERGLKEVKEKAGRCYSAGLNVKHTV